MDINMKITITLTIALLMDIAQVVPYSSDAVAVIMAIIGGLMVQWHRGDRGLTPRQCRAEIGLAGIAGFVAHAVMLHQMDSPRLVWSAACLAGCVSTKAIDYFIKKFFPGLKIDDDK